MEGPGLAPRFAPRPATGRADVDTPRGAVPVLPRAFPFSNGFADGGRQGGAAADRGRQRDLLIAASALVRTHFAR
jgi:hypothetical protein